VRPGCEDFEPLIDEGYSGVRRAAEPNGPTIRDGEVAPPAVP
jgi:hypothetical protein